MATFQGLPGFVGPNTSTGVDVGRGLSFTRIKGPGMAGQIADSVGFGGTAGPLPPAAGFMCVQSTASITNQIVSTSSSAIQNASFIYIPVTTGPLVTAAGAAGAMQPPYQGVGTAIAWNDNLAQLMVWSSGKASWMTLIATTSMSAGGFTTSV